MNPKYDTPGFVHYYTMYRDDNIRLREDHARLLEENRQLREKLQNASDFAKMNSVHKALSDAGCTAMPLSRANSVVEALEARGWSFDATQGA